MATAFDWADPETLTAALTTQLDGLTDGTFCTASAAIDNAPGNASGKKWPYILLAPNLASWSPTGGAIEVWIEYAPDGTNYSDHGKALQTSGWLAAFQVDTAAATAQRLAPQIKPLLPMKFKLAVRNKTGATLGGSGNTLSYARVTDESV